MPTMKRIVDPVSVKSAEELRRTFETAIHQIQQSQNPLRPSQTPIFVREQAAMPEKRAVTAAARALAQLWNISPSLIR